MKICQTKARIISNKNLKGNYWHLELDSEVIAKSAIPGQFVNIRLNENFSPFLRRPLSIHQVRGCRVKVFYAVLGPGTTVLSGRKPGEFLDIIGPLGNGFDYSETTKPGKTVLVAGGMGVAPLVFLAQRLKSRDTLVLIGAQAKEGILCEKDFKASRCAVKLATDDGSSGFKGRVTDLLKSVLKEEKCSRIFSCGPHAMLEAVKQIVGKTKIKTQLSLEEHMACGIGACLGCVVQTKAGYKRVCKDGPVFTAEELIW